MTEIYAHKIDVPFYLLHFTEFLSVLDPGSSARAGRFNDLHDAVRYVGAHALTRLIVMEKTGIKRCGITYGRTEHGKPFINEIPDLEFNKSHSGDWVVCSFGDLPSGADIEFIRPVNPDLAKRFFSPEERNALKGRTGFEWLSEFFTIWTLKESFLKASGRGISVKLSSFSVIKSGRARNSVKDTDDKRYFLKIYEIDPSYKLSVSSLDRTFAEKVVIKSMDDLAESVL